MSKATLSRKQCAVQSVEISNTVPTASYGKERIYDGIHVFT